MRDGETQLIHTASDRLARELRREHSLAQQRSGARAWEAPAIQSLRQWTQDRWTSSWPTELLLHPAQELVLWREAVEADAASAGLLSPGLLAGRSVAQLMGICAGLVNVLRKSIWERTGRMAERRSLQ